MTVKAKARKATAADIDPIFAAINEHNALIRESDRLEKSYNTARDKAEKKHGKWNLENLHKWPGKAITSPFYDRWNRAETAERKAATRMARVKPTTISGVAALIVHAQHEIVARDAERLENWLVPALKTAANALAKMRVA
jgi:hypothetical protein